MHIKIDSRSEVQPLFLFYKFWQVLGRTNRLVFYRHGPHRKRRLQQFFVAAGTSLPTCCYLVTIKGYTDWPTDMCPTIILLLRVLVATETCLSSRCVAVEGSIQSTESLPSKCKRAKRQTHR
jgi:hypothetical protein